MFLQRTFNTEQSIFTSIQLKSSRNFRKNISKISNQLTTPLLKWAKKVCNANMFTSGRFDCLVYISVMLWCCYTPPILHKRTSSLYGFATDFNMVSMETEQKIDFNFYINIKSNKIYKLLDYLKESHPRVFWGLKILT